MEREFVYIRLTGPTASFRVPSTISGAQLALEVPGYSSVLGMLSYAADKQIFPSDTKLGFRYSYQDRGMDLETIHRWGRNDSGSISYSGINIRNRQVHYGIEFEIIIENLDFYDIMDQPKRQLTFGRSQDLATIEDVSIITGKAVEKGELWGSLLPIKVGGELPANGIFYNLPEYFEYFNRKTRRARDIRTFLALSQYYTEIEFQSLWDFGNLENPTFYLHTWMVN